MRRVFQGTTLTDIWDNQDRWSDRQARARKRAEVAERTVEQCYRHLGPRVMTEQIAALLAPFFPNHRLEISGPFGIASETSVYVMDDVARKAVGHLAFRSVYTDEHRWRLALVDRSRETGDYPRGSLGALNGLNYAETDLPETVEELAALVRMEEEQR